MTGTDSRIWYLDTSVVLRIALGHSAAAGKWFTRQFRRGDAFVASRLTVLESTRVLRRENLDREIAEDILDTATLLSVDDALLAEAGAIPAHVKSLDALHLATAARVGINIVTMVTHDASMANAARDFGFKVFDPVTD